jgi:hypothetical protein
MTDLNEKLAQEAAELINGGEWRDGKWYSEGHRDAWRRALKPAADRIEKLEDLLDLYRDAVTVDVTMQGPIFRGANSYALRRAWYHDRKALEGKDDAD